MKKLLSALLFAFIFVNVMNVSYAQGAYEIPEGPFMSRITSEMACVDEMSDLVFTSSDVVEFGGKPDSYYKSPLGVKYVVFNPYADWDEPLYVTLELNSINQMTITECCYLGKTTISPKTTNLNELFKTKAKGYAVIDKYLYTVGYRFEDIDYLNRKGYYYKSDDKVVNTMYYIVEKENNPYAEQFYESDMIGMWDVGVVEGAVKAILYKDGHLVIKGDGKLLPGPDMPWRNSKDVLYENGKSIKSISFEGNVIGNENSSYAFSTGYSGYISPKSLVESINFDNFDSSKIQDMSYMFWNDESLKGIDMNKLNFSNVTTMAHMFMDCDSIERINLCGVTTPKLTNMAHAFSGCTNLKEIDISSLDTKNVTDMSNLFYKDSSIEQIDFSSFITSKVTNMNSLVTYCSSLKTLDISTFDLSKCKYFGAAYCDKLTTIVLGPNYKNVESTMMYAVTNPVQTIVVTTNQDAKSYRWRDDNRIVTFMTPEDYRAQKVVLDHIEVTKTKTTYEIGDTLNVDDLVVTAFYTDGTSEKITNYTTNASSIDMTTEGTKTLTITYTLNGKTVTKDIKITVNKKQQPVTPPVTPPVTVTLSSITATKDKTEYYIGDKINVDDIEVTAKYSDGLTKKVTGYTTNVKDLNTSKTGTQKLIITYKENDKTVTFTINIVISDVKKDVILITYMSYDKNGKEYIVPRNLLNMGNGTNNPEEIEIKNKKMTEALANVKVGDKISKDIVNKQNQGGQFKGEIAGGVHTNSKWTKVDKTNNHYEGVIYLTDTKLGKDSIVVTLYHKDKTTKNILDKKDLNFGNSRENPERLTIKYTSLPEGYKDTVKTGDKVLSSIINGSDRLGKYVTIVSNNCYVDSEWTKVDSTLEEYEAVIYWTLKDNTEKAVTKLVSNASYMNGYEDNTFKPSSNITREETAAILSRLCDNFTNYNLADKKTDFTDVKSGSWSEKNIAYISDLGIMKGDGVNFNKSAFITRGEFVTAVVRLLGLENNVASKEFQDAKGSWYSNNANILLSLGIISGDEKGNFNGKNPITRAEICKIVNNVLGKSINPNELETKKANNKLTDVKQTAWYYNDVLMATQN